MNSTLSLHNETESDLGLSLSDTIISRVLASLSLAGSIYIIQDVLRDPKKAKESTYHRLMLGLSTLDIIASFFCHFLNVWAMPKDADNMALGSVATCDAAGFLNTIAMFGAPLYNCSLTTNYLLRMKYNWTKNRVKDAEKWLHIVPWSVGIVVAVAGLAAKTYGPFTSACW